MLFTDGNSTNNVIIIHVFSASDSVGLSLTLRFTNVLTYVVMYGNVMCVNFRVSWTLGIMLAALPDYLKDNTHTLSTLDTNSTFLLYFSFF